MQEKILALFELLKAGLWEQEVRLSQFERIDFKGTFRLADEQSVVGLIAAGLEHISDMKPAQNVVLQFIGMAMQLEQRNIAMNNFIGVLVNKMRAEGIETLLMKGQGIAQCYERPLWRTCGDVDFLLSEDDYDKAKAYLIPLASSVDPECVLSKHLGMTINQWVVELHGTLRCTLSKRINKVLSGIHNSASGDGNVRIWKNDKTEVLLLGVNDDAIYIFTHILNHFYKGGIGLRQICDWCRLLWTYKDSLNSELLEKRIRRAGLMSEWKAFGALAVFYLGLPFTVDGLLLDGEKELERYRQKADRIMEFVLMSGNFGHNRDHSYFEKYPYLVRKCVSFGRRVGDLARHARIFPIDSLRFFPAMLVNGVRSAVRGGRVNDYGLVYRREC